MTSQSRLPNLIIAGVNKAGTTSLFAYLAAHPEICASSVKETCFYLPLRYHKPLPLLDEYRGFFEQCGDQRYVMESTPGYFYSGERIAPVMRNQLGDVRVIIVLRDPVARLISFYQWVKSRLYIPAETTFTEYLAMCRAMPPEDYWVEPKHILWGIEGGHYARYLPAWLDMRVKIVFFEELNRDRGALLRHLCGWLEIDAGVFEESALDVHNRSVNYRSAGLQRLALWINDQGERFWRRNPQIKTRLREAYYALNGKLFEKSIPDGLRQELDQEYAASNAQLREQLAGCGITDFPDWLKR